MTKLIDIDISTLSKGEFHAKQTLPHSTHIIQHIEGRIRGLECLGVYKGCSMDTLIFDHVILLDSNGNPYAIIK